MQLTNITATASALGNRIDLTWSNPQAALFPGVRVVRKEGTHPVAASDGVIVAHGTGLSSVADGNLKGETVYYYALFPFSGAPPVFNVDIRNRVSAMATSPFNLAGQMLELLPAIYQRYDTVLPRIFPVGMLTADRQAGQLRRFLDLPGYQLDQLFSLARAIRNLYNLNRVDGKLLPLLAEWIGWKTDYSLEIAAQRNEIRDALAVYEAIGLIPTVESTVKRITGWESRTKEFVHNVSLSNHPERMNIWLRRRVGAVWSTPTSPLSLNYAYEGKPAVARDSTGTLWLLYHTPRKQRWNIWFKTSSNEGLTWTESQPLSNRAEMDKHPTAAAQGATLWVFWETCSSADQKWRIDFRTRTGGVLSAIQTFGSAGTERRLPSAVTDNTGGLWLFWLEKVGTRWDLKYNRHNGTIWQLTTPASFPLDAGADPRVEGDIAVLFHPTSVNQRIWVFWSRKEAVAAAPGQVRSTIVYRVKQGIDPNVSDWSVIRTMPKTAPLDYHDRESSVVVDAGGNIEHFWSSNRTGSFSLWRNTLNIAAFTFGVAEQLTQDPYSQRAPQAFPVTGATLLIYRSNESVGHTSAVYAATETVDLRYAGSTTVHIRNTAKMALRGKFDDLQSYTYDSGRNGKRTNDDWYARDTVGLYLTVGAETPAEIEAGVSRIGTVLGEFMPIADRAVFIP